MNYLFPGDVRFQGYNFCLLPLYEILDALKYGEKLKREDRHAAEIATAILTATTINMNRDPKSSTPPIKPKALFNFAPIHDDSGISKQAARAFFDLAATGDLYPWALQQVHKDLEDITRLEDKTIKVPKVRAYVGKGIYLVAPTIIGSRIVCSFIIWENPEAQVEIWNIDKDKPDHVETESDVIVIESELTSDFTGYSTGNVLDIVSYGRSEQ